LFTEEVLFYAQ